MNPTAVSDLKDALRSFLDSVDGQAKDPFSPAPLSGFHRDTPGARAADSAVAESRGRRGPMGGASPNSGQDQGGRRRHLPEDVQQAAASAQRLLSELEDLGGRTDPRSPGMRAASSNGGTRSQLGQELRSAMRVG